MKKLFLSLFFLIIFISVKSQSTNDYLILRVEYYKKSYGLESRLTVDLGTKDNHPLKTIVENGHGSTIRITMSDGTAMVIKNELDFIDAIKTFGYELQFNFPIEINGKMRVQYLFKKVK